MNQQELFITFSIAIFFLLVFAIDELHRADMPIAKTFEKWLFAFVIIFLVATFLI